MGIAHVVNNLIGIPHGVIEVILRMITHGNHDRIRLNFFLAFWSLHRYGSIVYRFNGGSA